MPSRPLPENTSLCVPYLTVSDPERALVFYAQAFGFEISDCLETPEGQIMHASMRYHGKTTLMLAPERAPWRAPMRAPANAGLVMPVALYVYCEDVDHLATQAERAGAVVELAPADMFWGDRLARFRDPDGYSWSFATQHGELTADAMPDGLRMRSV